MYIKNTTVSINIIKNLEKASLSIHFGKKIYILELGNELARKTRRQGQQALAWCTGKSLRMHYHMRKSRKRMLWQAMKSCVGWYHPRKILNTSSKIHFTWFNRINFKLILLTLILKSLFFKRQTLTATTFVIWYIFNCYAIGPL